jgi:hypothetical protein
MRRGRTSRFRARAGALSRWAAAGLALAMPIGVLPGPGLRASDAPSTPTILVGPAPLTPYTSGGCYQPRLYGCYRATGRADPGVRVVLTVTDETGSGLAAAVSTFAAEADDPGAGIRRGDWAAATNVTNLGTHGPAESTLLFSAVALDAEGRAPASRAFLLAVARPSASTPLGTI